MAAIRLSRTMFADHPGYSRVRLVISASARSFGVTSNQLRSTSRVVPLVKYRGATIAMARALTSNSTPAIGFHFNRDHTTVLHALRKYRTLVESAIAEIDGKTESTTWRKAA